MAINKGFPIGWVGEPQDFHSRAAEKMNKKQRNAFANKLYAEAEAMIPEIKDAFNDPKRIDAGKLNAERIEKILSANVYYVKTS